MTTDRPTKSDIFGWREQRREIYARMHLEMLDDEAYLLWSSSGEVGQAFARQRYRQFDSQFVFKLPPYARMGVSVGLDTIMIGEIPQITVKLPASLHNNTERQNEHEDLLRRWLQGWFYKLTTLRTESPLIDSAEDCLGLGMTCIYYPINWDAWPKYPYMVRGKQREPRDDKERQKVKDWERARRAAFPWDVRALHPTWVHVDPYVDPPTDLIIVERLRTTDNREQLSSDRPVGQSGSIERVTYCSADWYGQWLGNDNLLTAEDGADNDGVAPNRMGVPWFRVAWSGFGKTDAYGNYEHRGKGVIRDARPIIDMLTTTLNARDAIRILTAFAQFVFRGKGPDGLQKAIAVRDAFKLGAGLGVAVDEYVDIEPLQMPPVPDVVFQEEQNAQFLYEVIYGREVLSGAYKRDTAAGMRTRVALALARYGRTKTNLQQAWQVVCHDILWMVKYELKNDITVPGLSGSLSVTLRPQDIPDQMPEIYLEFAPVTEEERAAKITLGQQLRARDQSGMPSISRHTFQVEYAGIDNPQEEDEEIWIEDILDHPRIKDLAARFFEARLTRRVPEMVEQVDQDVAQKGEMPILDEEVVQRSAPLNGFKPEGEQGPPPDLRAPERTQREAETLYAPRRAT